VLDDLEDALVSADVGIETTVKIDNIERVAKDKYINVQSSTAILNDGMLLKPTENHSAYENYNTAWPQTACYFSCWCGVGKVTTIGKINTIFQSGQSVY
jgi:fused signal recognition particle receptor